MYEIVAPVAGDMTLRVKVDPLRVPRGHRTLPRGGVHATPRRAKRAKRKHLLREELSREG